MPNPVINRRIILTGLEKVALFDYTVIPSVYAFYDPSNKILSGGNVQTLSDSLNTNNAIQNTGADQPLWNAADNSVNNKPSITFDGIATFLNSSTFFLNAPFTIYAIVKNNSTGAAFGGDEASNHQAGILWFNGTGLVRTISAGTQINSSFGDANYHIYALVFNGASSQIWIDGSLDISGTLTDANMTGLNIGKSFLIVLRSNIDIY